MSKVKQILLKEAEITNNCPECFNQDLRLSFYQKHILGSLYHKATREISHKIQCNKCGSIIYPVDWTDDIERSFDYYKKTVSPKKASIRFTRLAYIILIVLIVLMGTLGYLLKMEII